MTVDVVFIDDEEHLRRACEQAFELADIPAACFASADGALDLVNHNWPGVIVTDIKMAGTDGLELMALALERDPDLPVILITGHGDVPMAVQAMRDGAYDFIEKPFASDLLVDAVRRALEKRRLTLENRALRAALEHATGLENILIGRTPAMEHLRDEIAGFASADADVLILGETGTGKELVARSLHEQGPRVECPFVALNCGALPETMIESELFGHEAGAFTGAAKKRIGKFEHADGGTLFLDEVESMPVDAQIKLLRVLQDRTVVRLGSNTEVPVDVRVVAATKEDLRGAVDEGRFREDLYYRLNVLRLSIPPLRERRDDIPLLFENFVRHAADRLKRGKPAIGPAALAALAAHDWPGNVRELQNAALRYAMGLRMDIPGAGAVGGDDGGGEPYVPLPDQVAAVEKHIIQRTLAENGNSMKPTYEALGISRKTLYDKMQKHGIAVRDDG